ncbi:hypothetical protein N7468_006051 [Penicillium chermesinum]|uniref:Uncharacterized protein n=1 Tax=Penicillium chermesinum TaxID=63820 RepID=A0A9W9TNJ7_9EURO|nr:uncharacterized protein N7468_006051 [Penicillium chermesinum]KAJ5233095.1 hypothetical protein N7468_006051 [Penicillium chermesinum]KAJ6172727.1 hypothetical protein N7470_001794 [Penicillium chermesinum]
MEPSNSVNRAEQPPKQAAYAQASNPVSQTPQEQRAPASKTRQTGDALSSAAYRSADSRPANDEALSQLGEQHRQQELQKQNTPDVDLEYGVEQQPTEGYIADSVERKGEGIERAKVGAHADRVGSGARPGHPGFGEQRDLAANMDGKRAEHDRILDEKTGDRASPAQYDVVQREALRRRKEREDEVNVEGAVQDATGDPVVSYE